MCESVMVPAASDVLQPSRPESLAGSPTDRFYNSRTEHQMLVTTTPNIDGKRITKYCGVVSGEAILGANLFKDLFAGIRDLVGGRSATYERELQRAQTSP